MTSTRLTLIAENARFVAPAPGATSWYRGERCTIIDSEEMSEHMTRILTASGAVKIVKTRLLGRWTAEQFTMLERL